VEPLLTVDPAGATPLHRQVYDGLRSAILSGRLRPGDRLPATRSLAGELALSRQTVADAYDQLRAEGYVHARQGSGTFVVPDLLRDTVPFASSPELRSAGFAPQLSLWGRRAAEYANAGDEIPRYDLRPHRVASDDFPWDAWSAAVHRALDGAHADLLSFPPAAGYATLREAVAAHVGTYRSVGCTPDQVVIVNGSRQGLNLLIQLLTEPGARVAVEDPGYPAARAAFEARGLDVTYVPVDDEGMRVESLEAAGGLRLVHVTPSHQDPTGATLSLSRRLALLDFASACRSWVIEDDYDSEFRYEGRPVESLQGLDGNDLVIYAGTFSKSLLPGLRIGYLILPPAMVPHFVAARSLWDGGSPVLEQAALAEFMRSGGYERHIRKMRRVYRTRRDALVRSLARWFGTGARVGPRQGGLNLLVTLDTDIPAEELVRRAARAGIAMRDASPYYVRPPAQPTFLLGFAAITPDDIETAVARWAALAFPGD
jgi:GntR family transcriptional regulator/MocR family aminotransferase